MVDHISQVRSEARKVHDLFLDLLKAAFPDIDLQGPRSALSFSGPISASALTSPRQLAVSQSRRHKPINDVETDPSPSQKQLQRRSVSSGESTRIRVHLPQKDSRTGIGSGSTTREQPQQDESPLLTHPGELVVCKKRRNERDKTLVKPRTGSAGAGPVSPPSTGPAIRSPGPSSAPKDARLVQQTAQGWARQQSQQPNGSGGSVGWANPVKRLRTDSGKRRPSHL